MKEGGRRLTEFKTEDKEIPYISIITIVYNGEKHLERKLNVLNHHLRILNIYR